MNDRDRLIKALKHRELLKRLFCLHDYVIASSMDRALRGMNYYVCTKCGKTSLYGD